MSDHKLSSQVYERSQNFSWVITSSFRRLMGDGVNFYERSQALFQGPWAIRNVFMSDHKLISKAYERSKIFLWVITSSVPRSMGDQKCFYERSQAQFQALWAIKKLFMSDHKLSSQVYERSQAHFQALWAIKKKFMSDHKLCSKVCERSEMFLWAITSSVPSLMSDQIFFYERSQALFLGLWAITKHVMSDHNAIAITHPSQGFTLHM